MGTEGGNTGKEPPNGSAGDDATAGVTEDRVNEIVSKALSSRFRDFENKQTKLLDDKLKSTTESIVGSITATLEERLGKGGDGDDKGKAKSKPDGDIDITQNAAFRALQKDLDNERKAREKRDAELASERQRRREENLEKHTRERLLAAGFDPVRVDRLAKNLIKVDGLVGYESDESEEVVYREKDGPTTLDAGVKQFAASAEGKFWLPPRGAGGSGDGASGSAGMKRTGNGEQLPTKCELGTALIGHALRGGDS